ncbi:hypothetical protein BP00DRAFT_70961 [Aspergillus indologenus CBS 114.80]|uniref:Uncharacterized protein n=1 Tax=Aspergillus indologenus CBS 114.80 TaxID=1450541 RepID=A0A2V5IZS7_9EURO|nr:hypothetical protein BP00DRAFT_70961 [Aspergillus indologenus CBS 114.80]
MLPSPIRAWRSYAWQQNVMSIAYCLRSWNRCHSASLFFYVNSVIVDRFYFALLVSLALVSERRVYDSPEGNLIFVSSFCSCCPPVRKLSVDISRRYDHRKHQEACEFSMDSEDCQGRSTLQLRSEKCPRRG